MTDTGRTTALPLGDGRLRSFAAGVFYGGCCILFLTTALISWPLGSSFVDEGSVTKLRLAIAMLACAQMFALLFVGLLLFRLLKKVQVLTDAIREPAEVTTNRHSQFTT